MKKNYFILLAAITAMQASAIESQVYPELPSYFP